MPSEYRAIWSTAGGGTGYSVFHFQPASDAGEAQALANSVRAFFNSLVGLFPDEVTITFDTELVVLADDGTLVEVFAVTPPAQVVGSQATTYNRAAGLRIDWGTGRVVAGRRLTGRTYLVPASSGAFDTAGLVNAATITAVTNAANTLITATSPLAPLVVWSRTHSVSFAVTNASVPPKGAILTGRRD